jgi:hypothetical protein
MCPIQAHFQQFITKYTRGIGSTEMSSSDAMKHYKTFMHLTEKIIEKKIEMFDFTNFEETPNIIISLLLMRFAMIRDILFKIQTEKGHTGLDYNDITSYVQTSIDLYTSYHGKIEDQIKNFEDRTKIAQMLAQRLANGNHDDDENIMDKIQKNYENMGKFAQHLSTLKKRKEESSVINELTSEIKDLHGRASAITLPVTPQRPPRALGPPPLQQEEGGGGGVRHKRVKKKNSKSKKYKNKKSKTKKYKKLLV